MKSKQKVQKKEQRKHEEKKEREAINDILPEGISFSEDGEYEQLMLEREMSPVFTEQLIAENNPLFLQELEATRLLLLYGGEEIDGGGYVFEYIFGELQQIKMVSPVLKTIWDSYKEEVEKGNFPDDRFFLRHANEDVKQIVVDLIAEKDILSDNWNTKHKVFVPNKDDNKAHVMYTSILRLKFRALKRMSEEAMELLKAPLTIDEQLEAMKVYQKLKGEQDQLAKYLGIVAS